MHGKIESALVFDRIVEGSKDVSGALQTVYVSFFEVRKLSCHRKTHDRLAFSVSHKRT